MTALLASVLSPAEAEAALAGGADVIDLKDPARGALGALPPEVIATAVTAVAGRRLVSATAGDLPMEPAPVLAAVERIAATGVDFVKLGLFPGGDRLACLDALAPRAQRGLRLVAVLFADLEPDFALVPAVAARGFAGVMLDTADKRGGGLRQHLGEAQLADFVARARQAGLFVGLAGALTAADIAPLLGLRPDYLGFRGALTAGGRDAAIDPAAMARIRAAIPTGGAGSLPAAALRESA